MLMSLRNIVASIVLILHTTTILCTPSPVKRPDSSRWLFWKKSPKVNWSNLPQKAVDKILEYVAYLSPEDCANARMIGNHYRHQHHRAEFQHQLARFYQQWGRQTDSFLDNSPDSSEDLYFMRQLHQKAQDPILVRATMRPGGGGFFALGGESWIHILDTGFMHERFLKFSYNLHWADIFHRLSRGFDVDMESQWTFPCRTTGEDKRFNIVISIHPPYKRLMRRPEEENDETQETFLELPSLRIRAVLFERLSDGTLRGICGAAGYLEHKSEHNPQGLTTSQLGIKNLFQSHPLSDVEEYDESNDDE